ncbi:MAG: peptide deformylase [bacterium]|nr:peptide deformylase [bacterium]
MIKIVKAPQSILSQKAQTVSAKGGPASGWDKKILKIIEEMTTTLVRQANPKGVGLAAPQIGYSLRIFITKPYLKSPINIFINPEITWKSEELTNGVPENDNPLEGCLSLPEIWGTVKRHASVKLHYQTPDGKTHEKGFNGFPATIIQHEMDHLEGHLFSQRVLEQKGKLYKTGKDKNGKELLEEIEIP